MPSDLQDRPSDGVLSRRRSVVLVVLLVLQLAALVACNGATGKDLSSGTPPSTAQSQPTSVRIMRIPGATTTTPLVPIDRTISDTSQVQELYQTVLHLPGRFLGGACAADPEAYRLTFLHASRVLLTMQAHTGLCGDVTLDRGNPADTNTFRQRRTTPAFWSELAGLLDLPVATVEPVP
jgi:hypothetical protein